MKLRNKKTGEIEEIKLKLNESLPDAIRRTVEKAGWEEIREPLIKDEKIRKAVRAWAEVNDFEPDYKVRYGNNSYSLLASEASIEFNIRIKGLEHLKDYTIEELCGKEEE